ncbi:MAG: type II toxin-antitoxin system HicA family toxin [bacterium]|nr:type II toxin-antitoxin system HicA family toxin [bacterium]
MPRPFPLKLVLKTLERKGFFFISQSGSHAKYRKIGNPTLTVIVPIHGKEILYGTFRSILRQSKLQPGDFE